MVSINGGLELDNNGKLAPNSPNGSNNQDAAINSAQRCTYEHFEQNANNLSQIYVSLKVTLHRPHSLTEAMADTDVRAT